MTDQQYIDVLNQYNTLVNPIATKGTTPQQFIATFTAIASQFTVTLNSAPNTNYLVGIFVNLIQIPKSSYSISSDMVTFSPVLNLNDQVSIVYYV